MDEHPKIERGEIADLIPDHANANAGTERGLAMLDDSLSAVGLGRSIVTDKHGTIIGGNKTTERAMDRGFKNTIVVHTTGDELVVVQRDDLDLNDANPNNPARRLAYFDNRVAQLDLQWNVDQLLMDVNAGVELEQLFSENELSALFANAGANIADVPEEDEEPESDGSLLALAHVSIGEPTHLVVKGETWIIGAHVLVCADVLTDWALWKPRLSLPDDLFVPYPGPFAPLTLRAEGRRMIMVQPDPYICGHILDRYVEVHGKTAVSRD